MVQITGTYVRTSEEKYEDFLSKLGVGWMLRKAATAGTPTMEITQNGNKWRMETKVLMKSVLLEFELVIEKDYSCHYCYIFNISCSNEFMMQGTI